MPKKYQRILKDLVEKYDFLYLDSLTLAVQWRKENKLQIPKSGPWVLYGNTKESAFVKFVYELIGKFYEECFDKDKYELGAQFARWLLKTPVDYKLPIPCHSELGGL